MLRCLWKEDADIALKSGEDVALGRGIETAITDLKCPKRHLTVRYDEKSRSALVRRSASDKHRKQFDVNDEPSIDDRTLKAGDILHVLPGKYGYRFEIPAKSIDVEKKDEKGNSRCVTLSSTMDSVNNEPGWFRASDHLFVYSDGCRIGSEKIAGFDLDGTLIVTKSGKVFPKDAGDWKIAFATVPGKLKKLREDGYRVVIFTNQKGISSGRQSTEEFQNKIDRIIEKLGANVVSACLVSPGDGFYRKPMIGMWEEFEKNYNADVAVDRSKSFYVGDAAGRYGSEKGKGERKDHSCSDRLFALNIGVEFMTPEQFFLDKTPEPFDPPKFSPKALLEQRSTTTLLNPPNAKLNPPTKKKIEVIVLVGYPASGKTVFYDNHLKSNGYVHVNRDALKTWQKCVQATEKCLKSGQSVVVDNTNPDAESRRRYVEVARKNGATCRCFIMTCGYDQSKHNNKFRQLLGADREHKGVNEMVINSYRAKFEQPSENEGFEEIVEVNFVPRFENEQSEKLYSMYLLEK